MQSKSPENQGFFVLKTTFAGGAFTTIFAPDF
jgi:hypothetical protein